MFNVKHLYIQIFCEICQNGRSFLCNIANLRVFSKYTLVFLYQSCYFKVND